MLRVIKNGSPPLLVRYCRDVAADWDGPDTRDGLTFTQVKEELRVHLVREQHGLCAYCMRRIIASPSHVRIEHVFPRSACEGEDSPSLRLDYSNLLACCLGSVGGDYCCDVKKGHALIDSRLHVACSGFSEDMVRYAKDGTISGNDADLQSAMNQVLNLNAVLLKVNRKRVYEGFCSFLKKSKQVSLYKLERKLADEGSVRLLEWSEYWGCLSYFIRKKLRCLRGGQKSGQN